MKTKSKQGNMTLLIEQVEKVATEALSISVNANMSVETLVETFKNHDDIDELTEVILNASETTVSAADTVVMLLNVVKSKFRKTK